MKKLLVLSLLAVSSVFAQSAAKTSFGGISRASAFAYGIGSFSPAPLVVTTGTTATGAGTITLAYGQFTTADGQIVTPFATTAPITVGVGTNAETVTPSGVSCATPSVYATCQVTATFANVHGQGDLVSSGTFGMAEAVNFVHSKGGGLVSFDASWIALGGLVSQFSGKTYGWANTNLLDWRGTTTAKSYAATNGSAYAATAISLY